MKRISLFCLLLTGCLAGPVQPNPSPSPVVKRNPLAAVVAQEVQREQADRSQLASDIAARVRDKSLTSPEDQGRAWNAGDATISQRTSSAISSALKEAFKTQPAEEVWDQVSEGYRP